MSHIESLPDGVLCHIVSLVISELRKLCVVSIRFREICMMPHWYTKFILELNPTRFRSQIHDINTNPSNHSNPHHLPLSFQRGTKHQVIIEDPQHFIRLFAENENDQNSDSLKQRLVHFPWRHFSVFDLVLVPGDSVNVDDDLQKCIELILPYFHSVEISPSTKRQSDVITLSESLFCDRRWDDIYHLSLNGKIQFVSKSQTESDSNFKSNLNDDSALKSTQCESPGLHLLFTLTLRHIEYLELNFVCYPERDWISDTILPLKQLIILDLWRCQWRAQSVIALTSNIELFRVFDCTVDTRYDLSRCADRIRVISTDCLQCTASPDLLRQTSRLMARHENGERVHLVISHIRSTMQCLKALEAMMTADINRLHIVYSRDQFKGFDAVQHAVEEMLSLKSNGNRNKNENKKRNHDHDVDDELNYNAEQESDDHFDGFHGNKPMTVIYGKLSVNIFAASNHYALFRKLLKIGRLRGTFKWKDNERQNQSQSISQHDRHPALPTV